MTLKLAAVLVTLLAAAPRAPLAPQATASRADVRQSADAAFAAAYNLNYDEAMRLATGLVADHPEASAAHRALATVIWMHVLFDRGALTMDHYLGTVSQSNIQMPPPPADRAARFKQHVDRAIALADADIRRHPQHVDARYDLGVAHGLLASWSATVDGKVASAFGSARRAFDAHEWVLEHAPARQEAGLIVGTYRYAVGALSFPKRWLAYLAGFGGDKITYFCSGRLVPEGTGRYLAPDGAGQPNHQRSGCLSCRRSVASTVLSSRVRDSVNAPRLEAYPARARGVTQRAWCHLVPLGGDRAALLRLRPMPHLNDTRLLSC
jgi:hypothetical protein